MKIGAEPTKFGFSYKFFSMVMKKDNTIIDILVTVFLYCFRILDKELKFIKDCK